MQATEKFILLIKQMPQVLARKTKPRLDNASKMKTELKRLKTIDNDSKITV